MISSSHKLMFLKPVHFWCYEESSLKTQCVHVTKAQGILKRQTYIGFQYSGIPYYQVPRMSNFSQTGCLVTSRSPLAPILTRPRGWRSPMNSEIVTRASLMMLRSRAGCPTPTRFETLPARCQKLFLFWSYFFHDHLCSRPRVATWKASVRMRWRW